jgi:hypothetical protein
MSIKPKDLNQTNSGYGYKQMQHSWQDATLVLLAKVMNYYQNGGYDRVIRDGKENRSHKGSQAKTRINSEP